jgi:hypothetical protein
VAGLVAVVSHSRDAPGAEAELIGLLDAFASTCGDAPHRRLSAGTWGHVGIVDAGAPATVDASEGSWLAAAGAVHADGPLCRAPIESLDGQFAGVRYDAATEVLQIFNDPFGMQALYVATRDRRTYISTSATALARHLSAVPDELGMLVFLRAGYQIGPATNWEGIERLSPATALTCTGAGPPARSVYWSAHVDDHVRRMTLDATVDHCVEVALETVRRCLGDGPVRWADLTGGYDSRMVIGLLTRTGSPFRATTNGGEATLDVRLARKVAAAGGFAWDHVRLPDDWALDLASARRAAGWSSGTLDLFTVADVLRQHDLKSATSRHVVTGGGGEHFNSFPWQQEFLRAGRTRRVNYTNLLTMRYLKEADTSMLTRDPEPVVRAYFHDHLREHARPYADEPNTTQLDAIYAYKSVGHFGAYVSAGQGVVEAEIPCYYREIFQAAFSSHHRWRANHRLQRRIIERLSPTLAAVPTTRGGSAQPIRARNVKDALPYYAAVGRRAASKLSRLGRPAHIAPTGNTAAARYERGSRTLRDDGVFDLRSMRSAALFDPARCGTFIDRTQTPGFAGWGMLGRIAALELALRGAAPGDR